MKANEIKEALNNMYGTGEPEEVPEDIKRLLNSMRVTGTCAKCTKYKTDGCKYKGTMMLTCTDFERRVNNG